MNFIKPLLIKPTSHFNTIYKTYLKNPDNNESNYYILNLLKCHGYFITPIIITFLDYLNFLKQNNNTYNKGLINTLNDTSKHMECSICFENINKNEFISTKCFHTFCLKCYVSYYRTHLCKEECSAIKCPNCNMNYEHNNIYLVLNNNNKIFKTKKNLYLSFILNKLNITNKLKDTSFEDSLIYNIGFKGVYLLKKFYKNEYPMNTTNNSLKVILTEEISWFYFFNTIIDKEHILQNDFLLKYKNVKMTFLDLNKKILIINYKYLIEFIKFLLYIKNQYNSRFKINFIFTEPYDYKKKEFLIQNLNLLLINYENKFNAFSFKQLIIKNTIDHKIFKEEAILY